MQNTDHYLCDEVILGENIVNCSQSAEKSVQQFVSALLFSGFLGVFEFKAAAGKKKKKKQQELARIHQWVYTLHGQRGEREEN